MVIYVWFEALLNYLNSELGEKFFTSDSPNEQRNEKVREFSCVAIQNKNGEYLLVYNKKYDRWQIPGGKLEPNENPLQAAKREIFEETNLIVEDLEKFGEKVFYVAKEPQTISEIKFFEVSEIEKLNSQVPDKVTEYLLKKLTAGEIIHLRLPDKILAHGWLTTPQGKMSKSKGNVIDPLELLKKYPLDLLRIYLIAKINFLQDGVCDENLLREFYHDFLVNNLSNLVSRVNKMLQLYRKGVVPSLENEVKNEKLEEYKKKCNSVVQRFQKKMDNYELTKAFSQIQILLDESNKLIADLTP
ncbi:7702_t:CDS:2 [Funneliformis geosporum]|uniref:7702_t:CDS:1 n=1 Tax=Funneliformis geosporum TaxID=1117311 RepID=A0A9W4SE08_9GLOM|nr:7702_t:CDS:2 [Funneliformis geosporum]